MVSGAREGAGAWGRHVRRWQWYCHEGGVYRCHGRAVGSLCIGKASWSLAMVGLKHAWIGWQAGVCPHTGLRRPSSRMGHAGHGRGKNHARGRVGQHGRLSTGCRCRAMHVGVEVRPGAMVDWGLSPGVRCRKPSCTVIGHLGEDNASDDLHAWELDKGGAVVQAGDVPYAGAGCGHVRWQGTMQA